MNKTILTLIPLSIFLSSCSMLGLDYLDDNERLVIDNNLAFKPMKWKCENGDIKLCQVLGQKIAEQNPYNLKNEYGREKIQYPHTARPYLEKSCKAGLQTNDPELAKSCSFLAEIDLQLTGNIDNYISLYQQACDIGAENACRLLGKVYEEGPEFYPNLKKDLEKSGEYYDRSCEIKSEYSDPGKKIGCSKRAILSLQGNYSKKFSGNEYVNALETSCLGGESKHCYDLGMIYEKGINSESFNIRPSLNKAYINYFRGCSVDHKASCDSVLRIIDMFKTGSDEFGIKQDVNHAYELTKELCGVNKNIKSCKDL